MPATGALYVTHTGRPDVLPVRWIDDLTRMEKVQQFSDPHSFGTKVKTDEQISKCYD